MARMTESQLRSIVRQELKTTLLEAGLFADKDDRYGLSIEFGDYGCDEMEDAILNIQQTPEGKSYPGALDGYSKEEVIAFLNDRISRRCRG